MIIEPYLGRFIIRTGAKKVRYLLAIEGDRAYWTTIPQGAWTLDTEAEAQAAINRMRGK